MSDNHQFDDAPEDEDQPQELKATEGSSFTLPVIRHRETEADEEISTSDEEMIFSEADDDECTEDEGEDDEEDFIEKDLDAVNCQDWETLAGDLTKRYNRLRQTVAVTNQKHRPQRTRDDAQVLPATNQPRAATLVPSLAAPTPSATTIRSDKVTDQLLSLASKYSNKLTLGDLNATQTRKGGFERANHTDRADRATNEQVLDPRTRLVLFKMLGRGLVDRIEGCISTGKEANVYHAIALIDPFSGETLEDANGISLALKIYKTSILVFKDRDRYVTGEFRFRSGYAKRNPRKMVRLWAEKELRNLKRLAEKKVRCPRVVEVRANVLVMEFLALEDGGGWKASPRLKDADLPSLGEGLEELYWELMAMVRIMYQQCKLVHADLSEYNILLHRGHLFIIDVSQSVEHDHPSAFDFLRSDLTNIDIFFARIGVPTLGLKQSFEYVTRKAETIEIEQDLITLVRELCSTRQAETDEEEGRKPEEQAIRAAENDEAIFRQAYIPRTLNEVYDAERDVQKILKGEGKDLIYASLTGVGASKTIEEAEEHKQQLDSSEGSEGGGETGNEFEDDDDEGLFEKRPRGFRFETKEDKKERKALVKEEQRSKRKEKIPKAVKKRQVAKTSGKR